MLAQILRRLWHFDSLRASRRRGRSPNRSLASYRPRVQRFEERLVPSTTWIGGSLLANGQSSGGDPNAWSNSLNWSSGVPVAGETVVFTRNIIESYSNGSFHQGPQAFTSNVDLALSVGSVTTDSGWGGTINVNNALSITNGLTLESGTFGGAGAMTLAGNSMWAQGDLVVGAGGLTNNGTLTLNNPTGATDRLRGGGTLLNNGTIIQSGAGLDFNSPTANATTINNASGALFNITNGSGWFSGSSSGGEGGGTFINVGTLEKTGGPHDVSTLSNSIAFDNAGGTIDVTAGVLQIADNTGANTGGTFNVSTGAILDLTGGNENGVHYSGTYTGSGGGLITVDDAPLDSGFGTLVVDSGGVTFNFAAGMFQWAGGDINTTSGNLTNTGSMSFGAGNSRVVGTGTFFNAGTIQGSGFSILSSATFNNQAGALYTVQAGTDWGGGGTFINAGTLKQVGSAAGVTTMGVNNLTFSNTGGTINVQAGVFRIAELAGANTGGVFDVSPGAVLDLTGGDNNGVHYSGNYTGSGGGLVTVSYAPLDGNGSGVLVIDSGGATFNFPAGMFQWAGGEIDVSSGNLTNTGSMTFAGGLLLSSSSTGTLTNNGTIQGTGFGFNGGTFDNTASGTYIAQAGDGWSGNGSGVFKNEGLLQQVGSAAGISVMAINNSMAFDNLGGTIAVQAGVFEIQDSQGANTGGTFNVSPGAVLDLTGGKNDVHYSGTYQGSGGGVVTVSDELLGNDGRLDIDAGGATFKFPAGMFQWAGGEIDTTGGNITNTGSMTFGGGILQGNGTFFNAGTIQGTGFTFRSSSAANATTFNNQARSKYIAPAGTGWGSDSGGGTFVNAGTLSQSGDSTATSTLFNSIVFSNTGTVSVTAGTLNIAAQVTQVSSGTLAAGIWTISGVTVPATLNMTSANINTLGTKARVTLAGSQASFTNLSSLAAMLQGSSLTLSSRATLATNGGLTNNGLLTLNAGSVLTVNGAFTEGSTATLTVQLGGTNSVPSFGQVVSAGPVSLAGKLTLKETSLSLNYTSPATVQFITNTGAPGSDLTTGSFAVLPDGSTIKIGAMSFTIHYGGGDGNDVTLTK